MSSIRILKSSRLLFSPSVPHAPRLGCRRLMSTFSLQKPALVDPQGVYSYQELASFADQLSQQLVHDHGVTRSRPIALLLPRDVTFVSGLLACWNLGAAVVPLDSAYPDDDLKYFIQRSATGAVLSVPENRDRLQGLGLPETVKVLPLPRYAFLNSTPNSSSQFTSTLQLPFLSEKNDSQTGVILFTSGTTARPKGVAISHGNLRHRIYAMQQLWRWTEADRMLQCLPLNHVHGLENALLTALATGATCIMLPAFRPKELWSALLDPITAGCTTRPNMFTSVPTVYAILCEYFKQNFENDGTMRNRILEACLNFRLMMSGSASLPTTISTRWQQITGQRLVERYGMTELGMALGQLLHLPADLQAGTVGRPFPGVQVRLVSTANEEEILLQADATDTRVVAPSQRNEENGKLVGELQVSGPLVFQGYFSMPQETAATFTKDGWFKTGDIVAYDSQTQLFSIMGRASVDIIKHGGHKISALQIERTLLEHEDVAEVAVIGVEDEVMGEKNVAILKLRSVKDLDSTAGRQHLEVLKCWASNNLPKFSVPHAFRLVEQIPRNNMGKVDKKFLKREYVKSLSC